jgi:ATP-dependent DNA helicase RecG
VRTENGNISVRSLKGVGPRVLEKLARLGIHSINDLLLHLPLRYQDRTRVVPIGSLRVGDDAVIEGEVLLTEVTFGKRPTLLSRVTDGTGSITLRFYYFNAQQKEALARGARVRCYGEARNRDHALEMIHPEYRVVSTEAALPVEENLTPIYPATEGLNQHSLRKLTAQALLWWQQHAAEVTDPLPDAVLSQFRLARLHEVIPFVHRPPPNADQSLLEAKRHPAQQRLIFEELLAQHLALRRLRETAQRQRAPALPLDGSLTRRFVNDLPFALTGAQLRTIAEITADLALAQPMQRLVQGDVGCGKTIVAAHAALHAVEAGYQAALMMPTELLAEQHFKNFTRWLAPLNVEIAWLTGKVKTAARRAALERIASGAARVVIGTHALFQEQVVFAKLGLVIIDEQHRFGVHQRLALREKGAREGVHPPHRDVQVPRAQDAQERPHQLIMTATPIPRTLAMTVYADLDCSIIDELPPGRTPIDTVVAPDTRRDHVVERIRAACAAGRQAYWVCTLIEESETLQAQAAQDATLQLQAALPELNIGLIHGRMKSAEKERVMARFHAREISVLVATTVIEVGVDVPNASLIVIENSERLGLAQLHQLRGRVGRGAVASACVLLYHAPLSQQARLRLAALRDTNDGFEIARRDLEQRGPGEVLGTKQTGLTELRIADLQRDQALVPKVAQAAQVLLEHYPHQVDTLVARWVGNAISYGEV